MVSIVIIVVVVLATVITCVIGMLGCKPMAMHNGIYRPRDPLHFIECLGIGLVHLYFNVWFKTRVETLQGLVDTELGRPQR